MKAIPFVSVVATVTTFGALAFAHGGGGGRMFDRLDQNHDGKITATEADAAAKAHFTELDKNKDNVLSGDELTGRPQRMLAHADANHDGKLTLAELLAKRQEMFTRFDKNKDKVITKDEMAAVGRGHGHCRDK